LCIGTCFKIVVIFVPHAILRVVPQTLEDNCLLCDTSW